MRSGFVLGIDFGTSNTVAVLAWPDGPVKPLLFDGSPLLRSAVYLDRSGRLVVGRDAVHSARLDPARYEPNPKRGIDHDAVLLGDAEVPVTDLVAAVLRRVVEEAHRTTGGVAPVRMSPIPPRGGRAAAGSCSTPRARPGWHPCSSSPSRSRPRVRSSTRSRPRRDRSVLVVYDLGVGRTVVDAGRSVVGAGGAGADDQ